MYEDLLVGFEFEVEGRDQDIFNLMRTTQPITGLDDTYIESYHHNRWKTLEDRWRLENDASVSGAEFISPPKKYKEAKEIMKEFFKGIEKTEGITTTDSCGIHCNISINGDLRNINKGAFISYINQSLLYKLWPDRFTSNHIYCYNSKRILNRLLCTYPVTAEKLATNFLYTDYGFITIKTMDNEETEYLEIRVPGGKDYHKKVNAIFATIEHIADALYKSEKTNQKIQKKIISYVNRVNNNVPPNDIFQIEYLASRLKKNDIPIEKCILLMDSEINTLKWGSADEVVIYNKFNYLYYLIKSLLLYGNNTSLDRFFNLEKVSQINIDIPKDETTSEKLKVLKHLKKLPIKFCDSLITSLNKRGLQHFVKYNPTYKIHKLRNTKHFVASTIQQRNGYFTGTVSDINVNGSSIYYNDSNHTINTGYSNTSCDISATLTQRFSHEVAGATTNWAAARRAHN